MNETGLLGAGWSAVRRNIRYIVWFWLLSLVLARLGSLVFKNQVSAILDNSLHADRLVHGFNLVTLIELFSLPQTGSMPAMAAPVHASAVLFALATLFLMPGVLRQYTSDHRVARDEFFRTCGRNLWRFVRLTLMYVLFAGPIAGILFAIRNGLGTLADKSLEELLPFWVGTLMLLLIFLVMTMVRIWFDLAEVDVVVRDQNAVRKSVANGFRYAWRFLGKLLSSYVAISLFALIVLLGGIWLWYVAVPSSSVAGAWLISQIMLFLWLVARFWQRAVAAAFYMREMLVAPSYSPFRAPEPGAAVPAPPAPGAPPVPPAPLPNPS